MGVAAEEYLSAEFRVPRLAAAGDAAAFDRVELEARTAESQLALVEALRVEPGVRDIAVGTALPGMDHPYARFRFEDVESVSRANPTPARAWVDPEYFDAFDQPILMGRGFTSSDQGDRRAVVIVNTTFVDRALGGRNPLGRRLRLAREEEGPWYEIIGVVPDLGTLETNSDGDGAVYHPLVTGEGNPLQLAIRIGEDPEAFTSRLRDIAMDIDPSSMISSPLPLDAVPSFNRRALVWGTVGITGFIAILIALSVSGVYALMSFTVSERTREIGIRTALGAPKARIALTIARRSLMQLGIGVLIGMPLAGAWLASNNTEFGSDHSPYLVGPGMGLAVLVLVATLACAGPTLRALRIAPTQALRDGG